MRRVGLSAALLLGLVLMLSAVPAAAYTISFSSGGLAAQVDFTVVGGNLQVVLTNTSAGDVLVPANVLTALFFDINGIGPLTPISALITAGSTVFYGSFPAGGNVGGEWAYGSGLGGAPGGATEGISSSGFGLFGASNFGGPDLDPPGAVDGLNWGIVSAGDNSATGNTGVTNNPLVKNSVTFVLSGIPGGFNPSAGNVFNVAFQYGTSLTEPSSGCVGPSCFPTITPEPSTLAMLAVGLLGLAGAARRMRRSRRG